ncbi:hypothetical protein ILYODFUR_030661 [Ilyodon furcidens]|uniref:Uncharacterized protein n=1 Tax=Ilyodon furcidens TaxID=33524 RepID=A0ABV0VK14_9TELE
MKVVPSSSSSAPPTQLRTTPCQLLTTPPSSCSLMLATPTKEPTDVFTTSTFSPISSPLPARCSVSMSQARRSQRSGPEKNHHVHGSRAEDHSVEGTAASRNQ